MHQQLQDASAQLVQRTASLDAAHSELAATQSDLDYMTDALAKKETDMAGASMLPGFGGGKHKRTLLP